MHSGRWRPWPGSRPPLGTWGPSCWPSWWWGPCPGKPGGQGEAFAIPGHPVAHHPQLLPGGWPWGALPLAGPILPGTGLASQPSQAQGRRGRGCGASALKGLDLTPCSPAHWLWGAEPPGGAGRGRSAGARSPRRLSCVPPASAALAELVQWPSLEGCQTGSHPEAVPGVVGRAVPGLGLEPVARSCAVKGQRGATLPPRSFGCQGHSPHVGCQGWLLPGPGCPWGQGG